jgi:Mrp family chromosome partitioning ATPase
MVDDGQSTQGVTIPGAAFKRPFTVLTCTLVGLGLGLWFSGQGGEQYVATAEIVVEDPQTTVSDALVLSPERYVAEQVAVFELDSVAESAAELATIEHAEAVRERSTTQVAVGSSEPVVVGVNGEVSLVVGDEQIEKQTDESVLTAVPGAAVVSAEGVVLRDDGSPVLGTGGRPVTFGPADVLIVRSDGLIVIARTDASPVLVSAQGVAIDIAAVALATSSEDGASDDTTDEAAGGSESNLPTLPDGVAVSDRQVLVSAEPYTLTVERGLRPIITESATGDVLVQPGRDTPVGINDRFIFLGTDGKIVAQSDQETFVAREEGRVVLDSLGEVVEQDPDVEIEGPVVVDLEQPIEFDRRMIVANRTVRVIPDSSVIEVNYTAETEELAQIGANAIIDSYTQLRSTDVSAATQSALEQADSTIAAALQDLVDIEAELTLELAANPDRNELVAQYDAVLAELADAGADVIGGAEPEQAALRVRDLLVQLDAIERVTRVEVQRGDVPDIVARRDQARDRLRDLRAQRDQISITGSGSRSNVVLSSPATEAEVIARLGPTRLGVVGAVIGLLVGAALAYFLERRRPEAIESADTVSAALGAPLLSEVPDFRFERLVTQLPAVDQPNSFSAEAVSIAAATLAITFHPDRGAVIGVVSANVGDGKTTIAANLAVAFANQHRRVLAVDADLDGQVMRLVLRSEGPADRPGLLQLLNGTATGLTDVTDEIVLTNDNAVEFLTAGTGAQELRSRFDTDAMHDLFGQFRDEFDVIIVDVPPLLNVAYAAPLVQLLDGVVVVARSGTPARSIRDVAERLRLLGTESLGFIYNRGPLRPERTASIAAKNYQKGQRSWTSRPRRSRAKADAVRS